MHPDRRQPPDTRTRKQTEAEEIEAIRETGDTTRKPLGETVADPAEPPSALEVQGDLPGLDDNSRLDNAPGWDKASEIADEHPVGASPGETGNEETPQAHAAAFRDGEPAGPEESDVQVRPAGAKATRSGEDNWDEVDEAADESFPASDPPARY